MSTPLSYAPVEYGSLHPRRLPVVRVFPVRQVQAARRSRAVADAAGGGRRRPGNVDDGVRPRAGHRLSVHGASSQPARRRSLQQRRQRQDVR